MQSTASQTYLKNIIILSIGQALTSTIVSLLISISSLAGLALAPSPALSTVPVTATIVGTLLMIYQASSIMEKLGRRGGFMIKAGFGIIGGIVCLVALFLQHFILFVAGAFILGLFSAFGQYYRFAAIDAAKTEEEKHKAISYVMGGGVFGGILGPFLAGYFADAISNVMYAGSFIALIIVSAVLAFSQKYLSSDLGKETPLVNTTHTSNTDSILNKGFIYTTIICCIGFAVMTFVMNAAPLAIHHHGYTVKDATFVLQAHFVMMYLPSFFNAYLIKKIGIPNLIKVGVVLGLMGMLLATIHEQTLALYTIELALAGISWSFIFNGGTLLFTKTYTPDNKTKAQGINSFGVYSANILASLSAGVIITQTNWSILNIAAIPLILCTLLALYLNKRLLHTSSNQ